MPSTTSPNMGLIVPSVGSESGPQFANDINISLGTIDQHNHTSGNGVQIPPSGLSINTDLPFLGNSATQLLTTAYNSQPSVLASSYVDCVYVVNGELYYNNASGAFCQMTSGGNLNVTSGGISSGTASASFSSGVLVVNQNTNTPGNISAGSLLTGPNNTSGYSITFGAPSGLASSYPFTLPLTLPGSQSFLTIDNLGQVGDTANVDNSTLQFTSNTLSVKNSGITSTQLANGAITINKIAGSATDTTSIQVNGGGVLALVSGGATRGADFAISTTSATFAYGSPPTFTSKTGKVRLTLMNRTGNQLSSIGVVVTTGNTTAQVQVLLYQGGTIVAYTAVYAPNPYVTTQSFNFPLGTTQVVSATIGSSIGYNVELVISGSSGATAFLQGCLYIEDITY